MKMPWTKEERIVVPQPPMISDEEVAAREARWQEKLKQRAERAARIPENLAGYRLSRGCTCGADAERKRIDPHHIISMGIFHEENCETMQALYVQVIENEFCYICGVLQSEEHIEALHNL